MNTPVLISVISTLILAATLVVAIFQARALRTEIRDEHDWRRRDKAVNFSQIYNPKLRQIKKKINSSFGYVQARTDPLTAKEIDEACEEDGELREDINYLLAYLENIGLCCKHNVVDFYIIYDLMANTYLKYYYLFQPLMRKSQDRNPRLWENIEWMRKEIEKEKGRRKEPEPTLPKTGNL